MSSTKIIGIDLGTTNSGVSVIEGRESKLISLSDGNNLLASVIAFTDEGETLIGAPALRQAVNNPENTFFEVKRLVGRRFGDPKVEEFAGHVPFKIVEGPNGDAWVELKDGTKKSPSELQALILQKLREEAEANLGESVNQAVVTVPAYFNDAQRQAVKDAGKIAGLDVKRIVNEPTAAALAYGLDMAEGKTVAVYDLGGGTYDISILEISDGTFEVKAANGDTALGGADFDAAIVGWLVEEFKTQTGVDVTNDKQALARLKEEAEKAKKELSTTTQYAFNLPFLAQKDGKPVHLETRMTRAKLEELTRSLVERSIEPMKKALKDAGLEIKDIDDIVMVGGQTRMPAVREAVSNFFGKEVNTRSVNPDQVVALGAGVQGGVLSGSVDDILLLDVTPLSVGIETLGGVFKAMVERNTTIPTRISEVFSTAEDNQTAVTVRIYQGEREIAKDNKLLGEFHLDGIPPAPKGVPQIEVTYAIDANGVLQVSAKDQGTGKEMNIKVQADGGLSEADIERMIKDAEANKEQDAKNRQIIEIKTNVPDFVEEQKKVIENFADSISSEQKEDLVSRLDTLQAAVEQEEINVEDIESQMQSYGEQVSKIGEAIYKKAAEENAAKAAADEAAAEANAAESADATPPSNQGGGKPTSPQPE